MQNQPEIAVAALEDEPDHMKEIILRYVQEESSNPYALMITGDWGCGKTHYLTKTINTEIENISGKTILYVSVNGIEGVSEIFDNLSVAKILTNPHLKDKIGKYLKGKHPQLAMKLLKSGGMFFNSIKIPGLSLLNFLNPTKFLEALKTTAQGFSDFSKNIIVIDDLERISPKIGHEEILGFINTNFVEHNKIKVVILCDEKQIKGYDDFKNIKEKVIGRTIHFNPNTVKVARQHIDKMPPCEVKDFLKENIEFICGRIELAEISNLRTLFFFLDILKQLTEAIPDALLIKYSKQLILSTLIFSNEEKLNSLDKFQKFEQLPKYFFFQFDLFSAFSVDKLLTNDRKLPPEEEEKYEEMARLEGAFNRKYKRAIDSTYFNIPSIFEYVKTGFLDHDAISALLQEQSDKELPKHVDALGKINPHNCLELSDQEFNENLNIVISSVKEEKYDFFQFVSAFNILKVLINKGVIVLEEIPDIMEFETLEKFFLSHIEEVEERTDPKSIVRDDIRIDKLGFESLVSKDDSDFYEATHKIYYSLENKQLRLQLYTRFNLLLEQPLAKRAQWEDLGIFIQVFYEELKNQIEATILTDTKQFRLFVKSFSAWSAIENLPNNFHLGQVKENLTLMENHFKEMLDNADFSQKFITRTLLKEFIQLLNQAGQKIQKEITFQGMATT